MITTLLGEMDESKLILKEGIVFENEDIKTTAIEYCEPGCDGRPHITGIADAPEHFCKNHIHRAVNVHLKKGFQLFAELGKVG